MTKLTPQDLIKRYGIGLTGGIATGKTTVARILQAHGVTVIDADLLSRSISARGTPGYLSLVQTFGAEILADDGGDIDRGRLGKIIFADPAQRQRLEAITHPLIAAALERELHRAGLFDQPKLFVYEAALIFETHGEGRFARIWATFCDERTQLERLVMRDHRTEAAARSMIASQMPAKEKALRADVVFDTSAPLATVERAVEEALSAARNAL